MVNCCGSTCTMRRSEGTLTARAASMARWTSWSRTSRWPAATATTPRLFCEVMCPPAMPTTAESMATPDICSAMSTASATASAARSISTTAPLRTPLEATTPTPRTRRPVLSRSAAAQQTLVVPISSAKTRRGRVTVSVSECSRRGCANQGFCAQNRKMLGSPAQYATTCWLSTRVRRRLVAPVPRRRPHPRSATPREREQGPVTAPGRRDPVRAAVSWDRRGFATVAPPGFAVYAWRSNLENDLAAQVAAGHLLERRDGIPEPVGGPDERAECPGGAEIHEPAEVAAGAHG